MKTNRTIAGWLMLLALTTLNLQPSTAHAQGTAFTYQGRLNIGTNGVKGKYDLTFQLFNASTGGSQIGSTITDAGVGITNGLFTATLNFGGVFNGAAYWLQINVRTNGAASYSTLSPRQPVTPAPYAIMANTASNLLGTVPASQLSGSLGNGQLANNSITIAAGTGLSGGGSVALGGSTTLNNSGVISVTGNADITASSLNGAVTLGDTATSANTVNSIVKRDGLGNFAAGTITAGNFSGNGMGLTNLNLIGTEFGFSDLGCTAVGYNALLALQSGLNNTAVGYQALEGNRSGSWNTAIGFDALYSNMSGSNNTANGYQALYYNNGNFNTANGYQALYYNYGNFNTAYGADALYANITGSNNVANGYQALYHNTTGTYNTANGFWALRFNTTGGYNVADGAAALYANMSGSGNVANGLDALAANTNGSYNTANGYLALSGNASGSFNTAYGSFALGDGSGGGTNNTAIGSEALQNTTTGNNNIALGFSAGLFIGTGNYNIDIGNQGTSSDDHFIRIGDVQTQTYIAGQINGNGGGLMNLHAANLTGAVSGSTSASCGNGVYGVINNTCGAGVMGQASSGGAHGVIAAYGTDGKHICYLGNANSAADLYGDLYVNGTLLGSSDRNRKEHFQVVDPRAVLAKVAALPISSWNFKDDPATPHLGPMAQDFYAAFQVGPDDKHIATVDADGVALAAIQGLNQKLDEQLKAKDAQIQDLKQSVAELKALVEKLAGK